ncbi:MAG: hypothetical protein NNA20_01925 [Nitrospira sp.]|nr:hypothetical protein [Nitrospira sp.]MCP9441329.1 hypothetical protein [Nitrospira sp.]
MERSFLHRSLVWGMALLVSSVVGCAGKGEVRQFDLQPKQSDAPSAGVEPVKIVIEPFEDKRATTTRIGSRSHLWGGVTHFDVTGGRPAELIAQQLAHRLQTRGWGGRPWNVRLEQAGSSADADILITGEVEELSANAKSRLFSTVIETKQRLVIQAKNRVDNSSTTRMIEGARTRTVFWFEDEDVRDLLMDTINDGIDRFVIDTKIAQNGLRSVR